MFDLLADMEQERNSLMTNIFPLLKDYCRERYNVEFQVQIHSLVTIKKLL